MAYQYLFIYFFSFHFWPTISFVKSVYGKCPKISNTLFHTFLVYILLFLQLFLKILSGISGMANSVDLDQTAPIIRSSLIWVHTVCICHFVRHFGVRNFRAFTIMYMSGFDTEVTVGLK